MFGKKDQQQADFHLYTVFDSKSGSYWEPMQSVSDETMIRQIQNLWRDPNQSMNSLVLNSEDYSLFRIGSFSKKTGHVVGFNHEHVANIHDLKPRALSST